MAIIKKGEIVKYSPVSSLVNEKLNDNENISLLIRFREKVEQSKINKLIRNNIDIKNYYWENKERLSGIYEDLSVVFLLFLC